MIRAELTRVQNGELHSCIIRGHAGFAPKGKDIVCAAVSILARTALDVLHEHGGLELKTDSAERGMLSFTVRRKARSSPDPQSTRNDGELSALLSYTADFLQKGFDSLQKEYPAYVSAEFVLADEKDIQLTGGI